MNETQERKSSEETSDSPLPRMYFDIRDEARLCSDLGNSARLLLYRGLDMYFCDAWSQWLVWNGKRWGPDRSLQIQRRAKEAVLGIFDEARAAADNGRGNTAELSRWAARSQHVARIAAMVELAKCEVGVTPDSLDADPWLLNVSNGTADLQTGELRAHKRGDRITKLAPVDFDPAAACPRWLRFLHEIFAGDAELINYVQRLCGLCLTGDVSEQYLFVFHGTGANGKSVFLDTITGLLGDYACTAAPDLLTVSRGERHPAEVADLAGRRLVVASETEQGRKLRIQLVKRLTGDTKLKARKMRQDFQEFDRTFKTILVTNNKPRISEITTAVWRRIRLVPFAVTIPEAEQDRSLARKLRDEWSGILNWLLEGCLAWRREGLTAPKAVADATAEYQAESDPLREFVSECCVFDNFAWVARADLYNAYTEWADAAGEKYPLGRRSFFERTRSMEGVSEAKKRFSDKFERVLTGIGLRENEIFPRREALRGT